MINDKLANLVEGFKSVLQEQQAEAKKQLDAMQEGPQKEKLKALLKHASSGKTKIEDVQRELQNILTNGR